MYSRIIAAAIVLLFLTILVVFLYMKQGFPKRLYNTSQIDNIAFFKSKGKITIDKKEQISSIVTALLRSKEVPFDHIKLVDSIQTIRINYGDRASYSFKVMNNEFYGPVIRVGWKYYKNDSLITALRSQL